MKKRLIIALALVVASVVLLSTFVAIENSAQTNQNPITVAPKKPFYVGVTYCGDSVIGAEQLIDNVKNYTNLFVLQSGAFMLNFTATQQICDYAVNASLNIILCYSSDCLGNNLDSFLNEAQSRWGSHYLGVYFNDEPAGHLLDSTSFGLNGNSTYIDIDRNIATVSSVVNPNLIIATNQNSVSFSESEGLGLNSTSNQYNFYIPSGIVTVTLYPAMNNGFPTVENATGTNNQTSSGTLEFPTQTIYYPNGTICYVTNTTLTYEPNGTVFNQDGQLVTNQGSILQFESYQNVCNLNPLLTDSDVANLYESNLQSTLSSIGNESYVKLFTSDYALFWFDYQGGYNNIFAELFGTQTDAQTLALVRGAADMQGKSWGVMIEPSRQSPLTLQTGNQIYDELQQAYEDGAEYGVVFNYAPNSNSTAGFLQDEQFAAILKFWTDIVQNPKVTNNVKGQDALVLPSGYGGGMRSLTDTIWGIWPADKQSQQVWNAVQASLAKYGSKLDIVYNEPTDGQYQHVFYWNQTI